MEKHNNKTRKISGILKCALLVFLILNLISSSAYANTGILDEAKQIIKAYYIVDVPDSSLDSAATVEDMVDSLGDPHSTYFSADEYQQFVNGINNTFSGIGIYLDIVPEGVKSTSVIENSPAYKAGMKQGDIITEADGHPLAGLSSEEAVSYVRGPKGTTVHLKVKRDSSILTLDIVRDDIVEPTVTGRMIGSLAYMDISSFGENTPDEFKSKLEELQKYSPTGYIMDLRNNPGGFVTTALNLAGYFISGKPTVKVRDRSGNEETYFASSSVKSIDGPVIFLINDYSASASEILSSAVKDYNRALIVGINSYGKGSVQSMFQLSDGSVIKLTVDKFFSPLGSTIDKVGVSPQVDTGDEDALKAAELLFSGAPGARDKSGYVKVNIAGNSYEIDLKKARLPEYWGAYNKIISEAQKSEEVYIGTSSGWSSVQDAGGGNIWKLYYPGYTETSVLNNVPSDKKFTIKFSSDVDSASIKDSDIELVDASSGEAVPLSFQNLDGKSIQAAPKNSLESGSIYYLVINNSISGKKGERLQEGSFTFVTVTQ